MSSFSSEPHYHRQRQSTIRVKTVASAKHRYAYLDGIRGIAALFVIMRHTPEFWNFQIFRSYLAVDIFFILSGFVIANAYGRKMEAGTLSLRGFFLLRIIRLYPVYVLSLCLAIPAYLMGIGDQGGALSGTETGLLIALSLLFLPGVLVPGGLLFPINGPYWSLFFELLANVIYGVIHPFLSTKTLVALVSFLGLLLLGASAYQGNLDIGFIQEFKAVVAGLTRASFGIFFGVLLYSQMGRWTIRPRPWLAIALICAVFLIPSFGRFDFVVDILALFVLFPACVLLAATPKEDAFSKGMLFLGSASYPIYVLHEPLGKLVLAATGGQAAALAPYSGWLLILFLLPLAALLETRVDDPLRRKVSRFFIR
jgi:peptidoglycan/LPS O-acetylase OafA/YrhL